MPFLVIKGAFRLLSQTKTGKPKGFEPDGDSMQFKPDDAALLGKLEVQQFPCKLSAIGSTQLRFEGIDALEIHFQAKTGKTRQPAPGPEDARDHLLTKAKLDPVTYKGIAVATAPKDGQRGYILSRALEAHGRPVAFVFAGEPKEKDGAEVKLDVARLRKSLNWEMLASGQAYPLFYEGLFGDLRTELAAVADKARKAGLGLWPADKSMTGLTLSSMDELQTDGVVFPKLFRRLAEFYGDGLTKLSDFPKWLEAKKEPVFDLGALNSTHFDTFVEVKGKKVLLTKAPEQLMFTSAKSNKEMWV